ncbi:MAG: hypothetical protein COW89_01725, partial [Nitrospinae bacterium CG22_combo_CG10-13_8_21_14_all_47_10]
AKKDLAFSQYRTTLCKALSLEGPSEGLMDFCTAKPVETQKIYEAFNKKSWHPNILNLEE